MKPGIYRMHFRGLSFRECWRFSREPFKFSIAVILKAIDFKGPQQWLPPHEAEIECAESDLSANARTHLQPAIDEARTLGYQNGHYSSFIHNLDPHTKEGFAYRALHDTGRRALFIGFVQSDASGKLVSTVAPTGCLALNDGTDVEFVNHNSYLDGSASAIKVSVSGKRISDIERAMVEYVRTCVQQPRQFSSFAEMKRFADQAEAALWDTRIERGLFRIVLKD